MIKLRPIRTEDISEIRDWPSYRGGFEQMDYALRKDGWLDRFQNRPETRIFIAHTDKQTAGFSLLNITAAVEAEFFIAIHPDLTGKGMGRQVTVATLQAGFQGLHLERIHLIVRKNNRRAARLYESVGFTYTGESVHTIQGKDIAFDDMVMTREKFKKLHTPEGG